VPRLSSASEGSAGCPKTSRVIVADLPVWSARLPSPAVSGTDQLSRPLSGLTWASAFWRSPASTSSAVPARYHAAKKCRERRSVGCEHSVNSCIIRWALVTTRSCHVSSYTTLKYTWPVPNTSRAAEKVCAPRAPLLLCAVPHIASRCCTASCLPVLVDPTQRMGKALATRCPITVVNEVLRAVHAPSCARKNPGLPQSSVGVLDVCTRAERRWCAQWSASLHVRPLSFFDSPFRTLCDAESFTQSQSRQ
jgi:hypothetical protein